MGIKEDYHAKLETLKAMDASHVRGPSSIPVDAFLQEAENLYDWVQQDKETLAKAGLDPALIDDLQPRCGALREAESRWIVSRFTQEEAQKQWSIESPKAYDLRDELLHHFRFAYRNLSDLSGRVRAIAEGNSHADMLQDLNDLNVLGKENTDPLNAVQFDMPLLDQAALLSDTLSNLLGQATTQRADDQEAAQVRFAALSLGVST